MILSSSPLRVIMISNKIIIFTIIGVEHMRMRGLQKGGVAHHISLPRCQNKRKAIMSETDPVFKDPTGGDGKLAPIFQEKHKTSQMVHRLELARIRVS